MITGVVLSIKDTLSLPLVRSRKCRIFLTVPVILGAIHLGASASASASDIERRVEQLAAGCAACHGTNGVSAGGTIPGLAGKSEQEIAAALREFKSGTRPALLMHQLAKGYSDEQLALLAGFFSRQPSPQLLAR